MKSSTPVFLLATLVAITANAGSEYLVKKRAKEVRDQQNERQGVSPASPASPAQPPARPTAPAQPTAAPKVAQPARPTTSPQAAVIVKCLEATGKADAVTDERVQQLAESLGATAGGPVKPPADKLSRLAQELSEALAGTNLGSTEATRLAAQLEQALNDRFGAKEMETFVAGIEATLRRAGAGKVDARVVSNDVRSIIAENQRATQP